MKRQILFYPILIGVYPVLALLADNLDQVRMNAVYRVGLISLVGGILIYMLIRWIARSWQKAALLTTWLLLLFYSYGHVYNLIEEKALFGFVAGRHRFLAPLWLILAICGGFWIMKSFTQSKPLHQILNFIAIVAVLFPILQISMIKIRAWWLEQQSAHMAIQPAVITVADQVKPDIYYIILDGYTRQDVLKSVYGYDNSDFVNALQERGFVLPPCAQSNYAWTTLSLSSTMYMNYIETFNRRVQQANEHMDYQTYQEYIRHNPVRANLASLGYKTVAFETTFPFTEINDADYYITANDNPLDKLRSGYEVSQFEILYLRTTTLRIFDEFQGAYLQKITQKVRTPEQVHFDRIHFVLEQLQQVPLLIAEPKFVFAHLVVPHAPFVFQPDGSFSDVGSVEIGYPNSVAFLDRRIIEIVDSILNNSMVEPIIIIQGDHGWEEQHRMVILNAYHLPGQGSQRVYDTITPVNTFRIIFDTYFGTTYGLVEDKSFFSNEELQFGFKQVPVTCINIP
jgi:hypothetical protein